VTPDSIVRLAGMTVTATRLTHAERLEQVEALSLVLPNAGERAAGRVAVDLMREVTGVHVQQSSAGQGAIVLRGLVGNQVLLLVNGIPINNATYRDGPGQYLATIDPETIERIEVIRGPASVLYGSDAQGGVVNLITRPHPDHGGNSVRLTGAASTSNQGGRGRISAGLSGRRWQLSLGGTAQSAGDLRAGGGLGPQTPTGFDAFGADAQFTFRPSDRHTVTLAAQHFEMRDVPRYDRYVTFRATQGPGRDWEHTFDPQTRQLAYARYAFAPNGHLLSRLEVTTSLAVQREVRNRIRRLDTGEPEQTRTHWDDKVYTPGVSLIGAGTTTIAGRGVALTWGGEFYRDLLASSGYEEDLTSGVRTSLTRQTAGGRAPTGNFPDGANADRLGLFLSAETELTSRLALSLGGRWSRYRNEADVGADFGGPVENSSADLTGQVGLVIRPARDWRVALRLAEGFRAPNLYDLTRVGPVPGGVSLPNVEARPERSVSYDISLRRFDDGSSFDVTVYYTRIRDFIDRAPGTFLGDTLFNGERVFQGLNIGTARVWGIEAEGFRRVGPVTLRTNLQYTRGEQQLAGDTTEAMAKIPPLGGTLGARWMSPTSSVWLEYLLRWASSQTRLGSRDMRDPRIPEGGTPGYVVHGIRAGTAISGDLTVTAGLENLTDKLYRTHASGVDAPGRSVWVGVSWMGGL
jgi:outer membrane receptor protein involved in Fe transport